MARTTLAVFSPRTVAGILDMVAAEVAGDVTNDVGFPNDEQTLLYVRNAGAGVHVLTFDTPITVEGQAVGNPTASIAAGKVAVLGPFPRATFNQDADGQVYVSSDGTKTECKYVAIRLAHA